MYGKLSANLGARLLSNVNTCFAKYMGGERKGQGADPAHAQAWYTDCILWHLPISSSSASVAGDRHQPSTTRRKDTLVFDKYNFPRPTRPRPFPPPPLFHYFKLTVLMGKLSGTVALLLSSLPFSTASFSPNFHNNEKFKSVKRQVYFPKDATDVKTLTTPNNVTIRYKMPGEDGVCETTPGVNSYSGYIDVAPNVCVHNIDGTYQSMLTISLAMSFFGSSRADATQQRTISHYGLTADLAQTH